MSKVKKIKEKIKNFVLKHDAVFPIIALVLLGVIFGFALGILTANVTSAIISDDTCKCGVEPNANCHCRKSVENEDASQTPTTLPCTVPEDTEGSSQKPDTTLPSTDPEDNQPSSNPSTPPSISSNDSTTPPANEITELKDAKNEFGNFTPEALAAAAKYLDLVNIGTWYGTHIVDGYKINATYGEVYINGEPTNLKTAEQELCDKLTDLYISGEWSGRETLYDGMMIERSKDGCYIHVNGEIIGSWNNPDMPDAFDFDDPNLNTIGWTYVPGEGTYVIYNNTLVKYVRGMQVPISGGKLDWIGYHNSPNEEIPLNIYGNHYYYYVDPPKLIYNTPADKLYMLTRDFDTPMETETDFWWDRDFYYHLYVFPDCNSSKIKYLGKISFSSLYNGADSVNLESLVEK